MLMSPSTSTPATVSPGLSECSQPATGLVVCKRTAGGRSTLRHGDAKLAGTAAQIAQHAFVEAGENERRFNRTMEEILWRQLILANSRSHQLPHHSFRRRDLPVLRHYFIRRLGVFRPRRIENR